MKKLKYISQGRIDLPHSRDSVEVINESTKGGSFRFFFVHNNSQGARCAVGFKKFLYKELFDLDRTDWVYAQGDQTGSSRKVALCGGDVWKNRSEDKEESSLSFYFRSGDEEGN